MIKKYFEKIFNQFHHPHRVYIVPTKKGLMLIGTMITVIFIGLVYNNNLILILGFLLFCLIMITAHFCNFNVAQLNNCQVNMQSGFAGQYISAHFYTENLQRQQRWQLALELIFKKQKKIVSHFFDLEASRAIDQSLTFMPQDFGKYEIEKIRLASRFPFGFFYAWTQMKMPMTFYQWPNPAGSPLTIENLATTHEGENSSTASALWPSISSQTSDLILHSPYSGNETFGQIDWKIVARKNLWFYKKPEILEHQLTLISDLMVKHLKKEEKLPQLSKWLVEANLSQQMFSLKIDQQQIPPQSGDQHLENCLNHLCEWEGHLA
jgi:uncharacterized protein (DUF58 family)